MIESWKANWTQIYGSGAKVICSITFFNPWYSGLLLFKSFFVKYGDTDLLDGFSATSSHYFLWHFKNVLKNVLNINSSMHMIPGEQFSLCKKTWKRPQKCSPGIICPLILNTILHEIAWTLRNVEKIRRTVDEICKKMPLLMRWVLPKKVQQFRFWREAI